MGAGREAGFPLLPLPLTGSGMCVPSPDWFWHVCSKVYTPITTLPPHSAPHPSPAQPHIAQRRCWADTKTDQILLNTKEGDWTGILSLLSSPWVRAWAGWLSILWVFLHYLKGKKERKKTNKTKQMKNRKNVEKTLSPSKNVPHDTTALSPSVTCHTFLCCHDLRLICPRWARSLPGPP